MAYQAYQAYKNEQEQDRRTEQIINEIVAALERTRNEIVAKIVDQLRLSRRADLDSDIRGLQTRLMEYRRYNKQTQQEQRSQETLRCMPRLSRFAPLPSLTDRGNPDWG